MDTKYNVFIIHQNSNISRKKLIDNISTLFDNVTIIEPKLITDLSIYGGRRRKEQFIRNELSLTSTNISILSKIVSNKLDNVLILEDDAIMNHNIPNIDYKEFHYYYLHSSRINSNHIDNIFDCHAMLYPTWQKTEIVLNILKQQNKL